jgi:hypothetical protein
MDGGRDAREVPDLALELEVRPAGSSSDDGDANLRHDLIRMQSGRERAFEKPRRREDALATRRLDDEFRADREHHRAPVAGGIRVTDRTAHGAHVANERVGDERRRVEQHVKRAAQLRRALDIAMSGPGSDAHMPVFSADSLESVDLADINDDYGGRKS